jgi:hypothetical protein
MDGAELSAKNADHQCCGLQLEYRGGAPAALHQPWPFPWSMRFSRWLHTNAARGLRCAPESCGCRSRLLVGLVAPAWLVKSEAKMSTPPSSERVKG